MLGFAIRLRANTGAWDPTLGRNRRPPIHCAGLTGDRTVLSLSRRLNKFQHPPCHPPSPSAISLFPNPLLLDLRPPIITDNQTAKGLTYGEMLHRG